MKFSEFFVSKDNIQLDKKTLVNLRWIALIGQYLTINIVNFIFKFELPFFACSVAIFAGVVSNFYLQFIFKKNQLNNFTSTFVLFYDLFQLSLLLYLTGGITNPFSILLIVPAIVASTFLTLRSTINLSFTTIVILIILTIYNLPLPHYGELHFHVPDTYLYALPISIVITLIFLCYFGARFGLENRKRLAAVNKLELVLAKEYELKTIGVQAAAAAHSLSTPLSTIKLVAKELEKEVASNSKFFKDIRLLHTQSIRCAEILKKLSMTPLKKDEFFENVKLLDLLREITSSFKEITNKSFLIKSEKNQYDPIIKRKAEITYGLRNFIGNASKFSNSLVEIILESNANITQISVCDDGPGFPEDIKNFLGEPYIHTKDKKVDAKSGLGLGTFIGKTLLERMQAAVSFGKCPKTSGAMVIIKWETKNLISI